MAHWRGVVRLLGLALGVLLCGSAAGHATKLSSTRLLTQVDGYRAEVQLNALDLQVALRGSELLRDNRIDASALAARRQEIADYVIARAALLDQRGNPCNAAASAPSASEDHVLLTIDWRCPPLGNDLRYRVQLFHEVDPAARHIVTVQTSTEQRTGFLSVTAPEVPLSGPPLSMWRVLGHYFIAGIEHIGLGFDHVAFLIAVLLPGLRLWPLVKVVTAFTLAHSVTLSLAVLGFVAPPVLAVEILIAASIMYVAAENFFPDVTRRRWMLTFVFGLLHGFGFAGALAEYGIPRAAIGPALAAFNVGVEVGQLLIVGAALSLAWAVLRVSRHKAGGDLELPPLLLRGVSLVIFAFGSYWLVERVAGV